MNNARNILDSWDDGTKGTVLLLLVLMMRAGGGGIQRSEGHSPVITGAGDEGDAACSSQKAVTLYLLVPRLPRHTHRWWVWWERRG